MKRGKSAGEGRTYALHQRLRARGAPSLHQHRRPLQVPAAAPGVVLALHGLEQRVLQGSRGAARGGSWRAAESSERRWRGQRDSGRLDRLRTAVSCPGCGRAGRDGRLARTCSGVGWAPDIGKGG